MSGAAVEIGRRLKVVRERAGMPQAQLARSLGVTQTAVSYWEAGRRLPGVDQLMKVADLLAVPVTELLPDTAAKPRVGAVLRAVAEQIDNEQLAEALERFADQAAELPAPAAELQVRAAGAREAAEELLRVAGVTGQLPVAVDSLAGRCGVRVVPFDFAGNVDGLVVRLADGPAIGLDIRQTNKQRRRFTLAHELGHYLLRHAASFHVDFGESGRAAGDAPGYNWRHERAANEFAASLLMPADLVRQHFAKTPSTGELAERFDVSRAAIGFRLASLGLRLGPLE